MTNETAPERIWATYNDAFGINWQDGQFTTSEQPACGRYTPYIREDISEIRTERVIAELEAAQARIAELEAGFTWIERIYYMEGKPAADEWRKHMGCSRVLFNLGRDD